jgi:hypothetical protein
MAEAVAAVAAATTTLLDALVTSAPPKDREIERAKAHERGLKRIEQTLAAARA